MKVPIHGYRKLVDFSYDERTNGLMAGLQQYPGTTGTDDEPQDEERIRCKDTQLSQQRLAIPIHESEDSLTICRVKSIKSTLNPPCRIKRRTKRPKHNAAIGYQTPIADDTSPVSGLVPHSARGFGVLRRLIRRARVSVTRRNGLMRIVDRVDTVGVSSARSGGRAGVASILRRLDALVMMLLVVVRVRRGCHSARRCELGVARRRVLLPPSEQASSARSLRVVVRRRWAEALLLLVMTDEQDLQDGRDQEQEARA